MGLDSYLPLKKSGQSVIDRNLPYGFLRGQLFKPLKGQPEYQAFLRGQGRGDLILRLRRAPPSWILYKRNLSREIVKKLQNYSFKWGKNNKFCSRLDTVIDLFSSHLMYESIFKRLVCTPPDLSPKFTCKVNLTNQKIRPNYYILAFLLDRGRQKSLFQRPGSI